MATSTTGSTLLQPLSNAVRLPIDQVNFVVCQLFALLAAIWFRTYLHSSKTSSFIRHVVATLLGLYLALFCFGWYALHFVVQSGISYYIMIIIGVENMHKLFSYKIPGKSRKKPTQIDANTPKISPVVTRTFAGLKLIS